jgi:rfaE bifunctional protein nucleotidyltransferase chain/domain
MTRAIFLVGCRPAPDGLRLREYEVVALPQPPSGPPGGAWHGRRAGLQVELSASWLILGGNADRVPDDVKEVFRGCLSAPNGAGIARILRRLDADASRSRVLTDFETARIRCERLRRAGRRLVFTNGVFDLFHLGHMRLLQAARALGDALVVGVNGDDSARRLKGRARPVVSQFARAEIVAGIRDVDFCVIFGQGDPRELLRAVRPHVLVKGAEYSLAGIVGRRLVESWGGSVHRVSHVPGWSSTGLMKIVRERRG